MNALSCAVRDLEVTLAGFWLHAVAQECDIKTYKHMYICTCLCIIECNRRTLFPYNRAWISFYLNSQTISPVAALRGVQVGKKNEKKFLRKVHYYSGKKLKIKVHWNMHVIDHS